MSKQAPGESYQGATTFFSMALAKTLLLFPTSFKRIDLFSFYVKINDDKTEFLVIGSRQQLLKIHHCSVRVGTIDIKPVKVARNLGAWFDSHFSMSTHISMSCSAAFFWLHNIKRISQFLLRDKLEMVFHAFVTSRIDYCNGLLYGLPDCEIAKLQRVQNAAYLM